MLEIAITSLSPMEALALLSIPLAVREITRIAQGFLDRLYSDVTEVILQDVLQEDRSGVVELAMIEPTPGERGFDTSGITIAPGFIDTHGQSVEKMLEVAGATTHVLEGIACSSAGGLRARSGE